MKTFKNIKNYLNLKNMKKNRNILIISISLFFLVTLYYFFFHFKIENFEAGPIPVESPTIYFINLKSSEDRKNKIISQCVKNSYECVRVDAVNGKTLNRENYKNIIKKPKMKNTSIACFLSHIKCLEEFIQSYKPYAIILEDDVDMSPDLYKKLKEISFELETQDVSFDIIFLGGTRVCGTKFTKSLLKAEQIHKNCNAGAFGYLISKRGAEKIIDKFQREGIHKMYDHQIRDYFPNMNVFYTNPPLVSHDFNMESDRLERKYTDHYINQSQQITIL